MPTLLATYEVDSEGNNANPLVTPSFTPFPNEVISVRVTTWSSTIAGGDPVGGNQVFDPAKAKVAAPGGFFGYAATWLHTVDTSLIGGDGSMTITMTPSGSCRHHLVVQRWLDAKIDPTPAFNTTVSGSGLPSAGLTSEADNSVATWCSVDLNSRDPATAAYLLSAVQDGIHDGHVGSNSVMYFATGTLGAAGAYTMGMTAPDLQAWNLAGGEIQNVSGPVETGASETVTAADSGSRATSAARGGSETVTAASSATASVSLARNVTDTVTAADAIARLVAYARAATETVTVADVADRAVLAGRAATDTATATSGGVRQAQLARTVSNTVTATSAGSGSGFTPPQPRHGHLTISTGGSHLQPSMSGSHLHPKTS